MNSFIVVFCTGVQVYICEVCVVCEVCEVCDVCVCESECLCVCELLARLARLATATPNVGDEVGLVAPTVFLLERLALLILLARDDFALGIAHEILAFETTASLLILLFVNQLAGKRRLIFGRGNTTLGSPPGSTGGDVRLFAIG